MCAAINIYSAIYFRELSPTLSVASTRIQPAVPVFWAAPGHKQFISVHHGQRSWVMKGYLQGKSFTLWNHRKMVVSWDFECDFEWDFRYYGILPSANWSYWKWPVEVTIISCFSSQKFHRIDTWRSDTSKSCCHLREVVATSLQLHHPSSHVIQEPNVWLWVKTKRTPGEH